MAEKGRKGVEAEKCWMSANSKQDMRAGGTSRSARICTSGSRNFFSPVSQIWVQLVHFPLDTSRSLFYTVRSRGMGCNLINETRLIIAFFWAVDTQNVFFNSFPQKLNFFQRGLAGNSSRTESSKKWVFQSTTQRTTSRWRGKKTPILWMPLSQRISDGLKPNKLYFLWKWSKKD